MLLWAGADPSREVAGDLSGPVDDDDYTTTAIREAFLRSSPEFLETTKICAKIKDYAKVFENTMFNHDPKLLEIIIKHLKAEQINSSENQSCENLEFLVRHVHYDFWHQSKESEQREILACIRILIDAGARWNPPKDRFRYYRRGLYSYDDNYVAQVIKLLTDNPRAAPFEKVWQLCNTPKLKEKIYHADDKLWRELNEIALERGLKGATKRNSRRGRTSG